MSAPQVLQRHKLEALTGLRFLAAAAIVVHHTHGRFGFGTTLAQKLPLSMGVSFFFVLSGFILFYAHASMETRPNTARFLVARLARIWPLHLLMLLCVCLLAAVSGHASGSTPGARTDLPALLINAGLLQSWTARHELTFAFNGPSWSISTEAFFYLLFPVLIWRWSATWRLKLLAATAVVAALVVVVCWQHIPLRGWGSKGLSGILLLYTLPPARLLEFMLGMLTAWWWRRHQSRWQPGTAAATLVEALALGLTLLLMHAMPEALRQLVAPLASWLGQSGTAPAFAVVIAVFACGHGLLARLFGSRPLVLLGEISFALYLSHEVLIKADVELARHHTMGPPGLHYAGLWAAALLTAWLLWKYVELPCRQFIVQGYERARRWYSLDARA